MPKKNRQSYILPLICAVFFFAQPTGTVMPVSSFYDACPLFSMHIRTCDIKGLRVQNSSHLPRAHLEPYA